MGALARNFVDDEVSFELDRSPLSNMWNGLRSAIVPHSFPESDGDDPSLHVPFFCDAHCLKRLNSSVCIITSKGPHTYRFSTFMFECAPTLSYLYGMTRNTTFQSSAYGKRENVETNIDGRVMFDMLPYMFRNHKLSSYSLNSVSSELLGQQKEDVHYSIISDLQVQHLFSKVFRR